MTSPVSTEETPLDATLSAAALAPKGDASPVGRAWRSVRRGIARVLELIPVSPLGVLLGAAAYAVLTRFARVQQDLVWLVFSYAALALCAVSPLAVLLGVVAVKLELRARRRAQPTPERLRLETGVVAETRFALRRPWYLPLVQLSWRWAEPEGAALETRAEGSRQHERVSLPARGRFDHVERRVTVSDVFGLARVVLRQREARPVDVLPRLSALRHLPELQSFAAGDARPHPLGLAEGDRIDLRRYQSDPARFIHWKVLARTRKLMVRVPERALSIAHRTAAFLVAGPVDDASAACARLALERGLLGSDWIFGTDLDAEGSGRLDAALGALMRSTQIGEGGGTALPAFSQSAARTGPVSLIVFAPSAPGPWLQRVATVARQHRPEVVIGVDGVRPRRRRALWSRLLSFTDPDPSSVAEDLDEVVRVLSAAGARVSVIDRGSGRMLSNAHRAGMRAVEARAA